MSNVLLVPGSFNPITNAHIEMATVAKETINATEVYFIPAHDTYVAKKKTLIPGHSRCKLIESATPEWMHALPDEVESFLPQKTYDTVNKLKCTVTSSYVFNDYYICLGMDNIQTLTSWYNWQPFVLENKFVACVRNGQSLANALEEAGLSEYADRFIEVKIPENNISSSLVRELCEQSKFDEIKDLVPEIVYEYMKNFYGTLGRI